MEVILGGIIFVFALMGLISFAFFMKEKLHMLFKKKTEKKVMEAIDKVNDSTRSEYIENDSAKPVDEWIWVEGYKATEKDMTCRDYQYTIGETHTMPEDTNIVECESGFHLCKNLKDVFKYYDIYNGHRFFKVRALVRKTDYERYGKTTDDYKEHLKLGRSAYGFTPRYYGQKVYDKLVAKSIVLERELTPDEILGETNYEIATWDDKYKQLALQIGIGAAADHIRYDRLVDLGYSETFARLIVAEKKYKIAESVGSQPDLSMDMKCWLIFKN